MLVELPLQKSEVREPYEDVAGLEPIGASPRGSTYWRRVQMCPREHLLANVIHWEPLPRANALDLGLLWHGVLETYYNGLWAFQRGIPQPTSPAQAAFGFLQQFRDVEGWSDFYDTVSRMLDSYLERWRNDDSWEILGVELTCGFTETTHPEIVQRVGFECTTRLDLLVRDWSLRPVIRHVEHKCLAAGTRISLRDGRTECVENLESNQAILTHDGKNLQAARLRTVERIGRRDVYRVVLRSGRTLHCSGRHPIFTQRGWVKARDLTSTDWCASPGRSTFSDEGVPLELDEVEVIGLMLGDGTCSAGVFTKSRGPVLDRVYDLARRNGWGVGTSWKGDVGHVRLGVPVKRLLEKHGLARCVAATKFVPSALLQLPQVATYILLGALWNTDGSVHQSEERGQQKIQIVYPSRSKQLCCDIQRLLLRVGIDSTVTESSVLYRGHRRPVWWTKVVTRAGKRTFLDAVLRGDLPLIKYPLDKIEAARRAIKAGDDRKIPVGYVGVEVLRAAGHRIRVPAIRAETLHAALPGHHALTDDLVWSRVSTVLVVGRAEVYNVVGSSTGTVISDDVITHNSSYALNPLVVQGYSQDDQVLGQCYLGRYWFDWGHEHYAGAIVNVTTKGQSPKSERLPVQPSEDQLSAWAESKRFWYAFEKQYQDLNYPRNYANCTRRFGRCQFFDFCRSYPLYEPSSTDEPPPNYRCTSGPVEDTVED